MKRNTLFSAAVIALIGILVTIIAILICDKFNIDSTITVAIIGFFGTVIGALIPVIINLNKEKNNNANILQNGEENEAHISNISKNKGSKINQKGKKNKADIK